MTVLVLALMAGAVVGLSLGALGGGGSVLAVPALVYLLGFTPQAATTASLVIVAATAVNGLVAHARAGRVRWRTGVLFAAAGLPAAAAAGVLSTHLPSTVLTGAFAVLAVSAAWRMLADRPSRPEADPAGPVRTAATGAGLGAVTGLLGVGGGFLAIPALVTVLALPMSSAVGTSLLIIAANSAAALIPRLAGVTAVNWMVVAPFAATAILGAWDGKRLAERLSGRILQRVFAVVLVTLAVVMLIDALR